MTTVECLHCKAEFDIGEGQVGKAIHCPVCKQLTVPLPARALSILDDHRTRLVNEWGDDRWNILSFLRGVTGKATSSGSGAHSPLFSCYVEMKVVPWGRDLKTGIVVDTSVQDVNELVRQARALQDQSTPQKIEEIVQRYARLIVVGETGFGKTSALKYLAWRMAAQHLSERTLPLPVYVYLGAYDQNEGLDGLIDHALKTSDWRTVAQNCQLQFLFDGLDEIPQRRRKKVLNELQVMLHAEVQHRYVVTTSEEEYDDELPLKSFQATPLTEDDIGTFVAKHLVWLDSRRSSAVLINAFNDHAELQPLTRVPVLLAMLVGIYHVTGEVPTDLLTIVERFVEVALAGSGPRKNQCLAHLAFKMVNGGYWTASVEQWKRIVEDKMQQDSRLTGSPLLRQSNRNIQFVHGSVREFFAARHLQEKGATISDLADEKPRMEGMVEFYRLIVGNDFGEPAEYQVLFARSFTKWHKTLLYLSGLVNDASLILRAALEKQDLRMASDCFLAARYVSPELENRYIQALKNKIVSFSDLWEDVIGSMPYSGLPWAEMSHQRHRMRLSSERGLIQLVSMLRDAALKARVARLRMAELFLNMEVQGESRCILCEALMRQLWEFKDEEMLRMFREPLLESDPCCDRVQSDVAIVKSLLLF